VINYIIIEILELILYFLFLIGKFLCWIWIHKLDKKDLTDILEEDGYSGKVCPKYKDLKNYCKRCGKYTKRTKILIVFISFILCYV
jgi:hypothetical protein